MMETEIPCPNCKFLIDISKQEKSAREYIINEVMKIIDKPICSCGHSKEEHNIELEGKFCNVCDCKEFNGTKLYCERK